MNERTCSQHIDHAHSHSPMRRTAIVVAITLLTMVAEITYGLITGSMALLADGIHMGTHTFALVITLIAYVLAGRHAHNPNFAFSTGKVGILGGYTNAILLGITALYMGYEAIGRLIHPETIRFDQALLVAVLGLAVNLVSATLLSSGGHDHHHHDHGHSHDHHQDHNLRAAYVHVITDALTSVLAIGALLTGRFLGHTWPDAAVAILGAVVILRWAYSLLLSSGKLLVDYHPAAEDEKAIREIAGSTGTTIGDLHIWKTSESGKAVILQVHPGASFDKQVFTDQVRSRCSCCHITIEVE